MDSFSSLEPLAPSNKAYLDEKAQTTKRVHKVTLSYMVNGAAPESTS